MDRVGLLTVCTDIHHNYLLAMVQAGGAQFLLTSDKRDLLELKLPEHTRTVTVRDFLVQIGRLT